MSALARLLSQFLLLAIVVMAAMWGSFVPPDQELQGQRFAASSRPASGDLVFVEIDASSLQTVGVWPWPRTVHAQLLDRLMDQGALEVVFDIDFSSTSTPEADQAFEAALERAGGYAYLAAFQQNATNGEIVLSRPLPQFEAQAPAILVNVDGDGTALLESVPTELQSIPAMARALVPGSDITTPSIVIDYGIDLETITRIPASAILDGSADPALIRDKQVVIGASAIELRDFFRVPRFGVISGGMVQIAATETLKANRALTDLGLVPAALAGLVMTFIIMMTRRRLSVPGRAAIAVTGSVGLEIAAWLALTQASVILDTMVFHAMVGGTLAICFLDERARRWRQSRLQQERLAYLARHDEPSGALTRHALLEQLDADTDDRDLRTVVAARMLRLDALNASLGHEVFALVAREVTLRLSELTDTVPARLDSDVFAFVARHGRFGGTLIPSVALVRSVLEAPYEIAGHTIVLEAVFGSARQHDASAADLVQQAEIALSVAQAEQEGLVRYEPVLAQRIQNRRVLDLALRKALERDELYLLYQPQIDLRTGEMVGVEALIRWRHPEMGIVSPADFIPLAEETGLIVQIGDWVLQEACRQVAKWHWRGRISVNVSVVQFTQGNVLASIHNALTASGLEPHRLDIEITESTRIADDPASVEMLDKLCALGVKIAMDDFGTGYSSLSYLNTLPIDKIKIDQSFVRSLPNPRSEVIIETTLMMAQRLGKTVVAEGIETVQQRDYLVAAGCDVGQGYLFGRPSFPAELPLRQSSAA